jgi:hypothetical protein
MSAASRTARARELYLAFAAGERARVEGMLTGDRELSHPDGRRGRNTEALTFRAEQICRAEVYFGWTLE